MDFSVSHGPCQALHGPGIASPHAWTPYLALYKSSRHEEYLEKAAWCSRTSPEPDTGALVSGSGLPLVIGVTTGPPVLLSGLCFCYMQKRSMKIPSTLRYNVNVNVNVNALHLVILRRSLLYWL